MSLAQRHLRSSGPVRTRLGLGSGLAKARLVEHRRGRSALTHATDPVADPAAVLKALPLAVLLWRTGPIALNEAARTLLARIPDVGSWRLAHERATSAPRALHVNGHLLLAVRAPWDSEATLLAAMPSVTNAPPDTDALAAALDLRPREAEVVTHVVRGLTNQEIADLLALSLSTVKTHLRNVYSRTGIRTRDDLIRRASPLLLWLVHLGTYGSTSSGLDDGSQSEELPQ